MQRQWFRAHRLKTEAYFCQLDLPGYPGMHTSSCPPAFSLQPPTLLLLCVCMHIEIYFTTCITYDDDDDESRILFN